MLIYWRVSLRVFDSFVFWSSSCRPIGPGEEAQHLGASPRFSEESMGVPEILGMFTTSATSLILMNPIVIL